MVKEYVIGLDIGTTSVKACLFDKQGNVVSEMEEMITSYYPQQGWVEQDPDQIERSAVLAVREAIRKAGVGKESLISLGFSAAMHSLIMVNEQIIPKSPAFIWADGRAAAQVERLPVDLKDRIYFNTGAPVHPMTPFVKLLWMKETGYEPYLNAAYLMSIKEYLVHCWFGERMIDYSMASATGLFNPRTLTWDEEALELAGVTEDQLSSIVAPTTVLNGIKPEIAEQMGIERELPFVIGAADGQLSNLGIGALLPGEVAVSVGTSGAIRQFTDRVKVSEKHETFCYAFTKERYIVGGPTNNGGIVLQWLKELLGDEQDMGLFLAEAALVEPGAEGLLFLPYINGERAPIWNQRAKGSFYGVTVTHKKPHFIRAVLEGVTFNLYQIGRALEKQARPPHKVYVNGGLARSSVWLQMMADIFEAEIYVSESHHSSAWGAAWTALTALGEVQSFEEIKHNIPMSAAILPNKENGKRYRELYASYERLAECMSPFFL